MGLDISKYANNTNINSALPSLEKERHHDKGIWFGGVLRGLDLVSLGSNNVCIYASLGTQAYLSLQPHVCQHRSP